MSESGSLGMFKGEYNHIIDAKGRLIIPARFREGLGERFVVTRGLDECLWIYGAEDWNKLEEKLTSLPITNPTARKLNRFLLGSAAECELDKMGRILLPQPLRQTAGLQKDVVLTGVGNKIEIWDKERWDAANTLTEEDMGDFASLEGFGI